MPKEPGVICVRLNIVIPMLWGHWETPCIYLEDRWSWRTNCSWPTLCNAGPCKVDPGEVQLLCPYHWPTIQFCDSRTASMCWVDELLRWDTGKGKIYLHHVCLYVCALEKTEIGQTLNKNVTATNTATITLHMYKHQLRSWWILHDLSICSVFLSLTALVIYLLLNHYIKPLHFQYLKWSNFLLKKPWMSLCLSDVMHPPPPASCHLLWLIWCPDRRISRTRSQTAWTTGCWSMILIATNGLSWPPWNTPSTAALLLPSMERFMCWVRTRGASLIEQKYGLYQITFVSFQCVCNFFYSELDSSFNSSGNCLNHI